MSDLRDLYQEVVLDHGRKPRNQRAMQDATAESVGYNPLCGDKLHLYVQVQDGKVSDVSFEGSGCAISTASASLLTQVLKGKTQDEARTILHGFLAMLTEEDDAPEASSLGKLAVFEGVKEFPVRVKCATLPWRTLEAALRGDDDPVTTE
jgi:nitrogen fixation NifU-like protein